MGTWRLSHPRSFLLSSVVPGKVRASRHQGHPPESPPSSLNGLWHWKGHQEPVGTGPACCPSRKGAPRASYCPIRRDQGQHPRLTSEDTRGDLPSGDALSQVETGRTGAPSTENPRKGGTSAQEPPAVQFLGVGFLLRVQQVLEPRRPWARPLTALPACSGSSGTEGNMAGSAWRP